MVIDTLDKLDRRILTHLQREGRLSNQELSERVSISPAACWRRVRALEEKGVIARYTAQLDPEVLGIEFVSFATVSLRRHSRDTVRQFEAAVMDIEEVLECHSIAGNGDYALKIVARNAHDYERIILDRITQLPGVEQIHSSISLRAVKSSTILKVE